MDDISIKVEGVSKTFKLPHEKRASIKSNLVGLLQTGKQTYERQRVLKDASFEIKKGEFFGIVGRNGSGKSTLLKMMAGIYAPTSGSVQVNGKLTPFIELGVGFNPELTGRENVFLNGALLGFSRKEMATMYDDIVKFAELEKFMDQKLKNYSSGMQVRLAFSIAIRAKSDILLIDEVLAVGDAAFQRKCYNVFQRLKRDKQTVVFVSHSMSDVERFCDKVLVMDRGDILGIYDAHAARMQYEKLNQEESRAGDPTNARLGTGAIIVEKLRLLSDNKPIKDAIKPHDSLQVELTLKRQKTLGEHERYMEVGLGISGEDGLNVFGPNTRGRKISVDTKKIRIDIPDMPLNRGQYYVTAALFSEDQTENYDLLDRAAAFRVESERLHFGAIDTEYDWIVIM